MSFYNKENVKTAVMIGSKPNLNGISVYDQMGNSMIQLRSEPETTRLILTDENGKPATLLHGKSGDNYLGVYDASGDFYKYRGSETVRTKTITVGPE